MWMKNKVNHCSFSQCPSDTLLLAGACRLKMEYTGQREHSALFSHTTENFKGTQRKFNSLIIKYLGECYGWRKIEASGFAKLRCMKKSAANFLRSTGADWDWEASFISHIQWPSSARSLELPYPNLLPACQKIKTKFTIL